MTYYVTYYINRQPKEFGFAFKSQLAAVYQARMIRDAWGFATDVMQADTGEIIAFFDPDGHCYIAYDIDDDARKVTALIIPD